jgi:putative ABC transport system permease protein
MADSTFFNLFSIELLLGSDKKVLHSPNQICISQNCSNKYFSDENPIGKSLTINNEEYIGGIF